MRLLLPGGKPKRTHEHPADLAAIVRASDELANVFAMLGDPTRMGLVAVFCAGGVFSIVQCR